MGKSIKKNQVKIVRMPDFSNGPGTSISPVSDYWSNCPSVEGLYFIKVVRNIEISNLEPKKSWW